jgi:hypothetical protein
MIEDVDGNLFLDFNAGGRRLLDWGMHIRA